jgi:hypothetical protein
MWPARDRDWQHARKHSASMRSLRLTPVPSSACTSVHTLSVANIESWGLIDRAKECGLETTSTTSTCTTMHPTERDKRILLRHTEAMCTVPATMTTRNHPFSLLLTISPASSILEVESELSVYETYLSRVLTLH